MKMKISVFVVVLLLAFAMSASATIIGSGTLNFPDTITATQQWASTSTQLIWEVSQTAGNPYHYQYQFIVPSKGISHMIIEVSNNFTDDDIFNFEGDANYEINNYSSTSNGNSNPGMPSLMRGIKISPDGENILNMTISFDSWRTPVLGDFYAKDGKNKVDGVNYDVTAWNTGFTSSPDEDITEDNHILRPDTVVPEPSSIMVLGMSLLSLGGMWKLKRK